MAHLIQTPTVTKEELNRILRLIQAATPANAAPIPATPANFGIGFAPTPSSTPSFNIAPIVIYPFLCDSSGTLVVDSEGFLSQTPITVMAPA